MADESGRQRWPWEDDDEFTAKDRKMLKAILEIVRHIAPPTTDPSKLQELHDSLEAAANRLKEIK